MPSLRNLTCLVIILGVSLSAGCAPPLHSPSLHALQGDRAPYLGAWQRQVTDATGSTRITLELRSDGTYTKTLDASLKGKSFHGSEQGSWAANGPLVLLSGDTQFPPSRHDLRNYKKLR